MNMLWGEVSFSLDELSKVDDDIEEKKSTTSDESSSFLGLWGDFLHQSFQSDVQLQEGKVS